MAPALPSPKPAAEPVGPIAAPQESANPASPVGKTEVTAPAEKNSDAEPVERNITELELIKIIKLSRSSDDAEPQVIFDNNKKFTRDFHLKKCCYEAINNLFRPYYTASLTRINSEDKQRMERISTVVRPTCQALASVFLAYAEIRGIDGYRQVQFRFRQTVRRSLLHLLETCDKGDALRNDKLWGLTDQLGLDLHRWEREGKAERSRSPGATKKERETALREEGRILAQERAETRRVEDETARRAELEHQGGYGRAGGWSGGPPWAGGGGFWGHFALITPCLTSVLIHTAVALPSVALSFTARNRTPIVFSALLCFLSGPKHHCFYRLIASPARSRDDGPLVE